MVKLTRNRILLLSVVLYTTFLGFTLVKGPAPQSKPDNRPADLQATPLSPATPTATHTPTATPTATPTPTQRSPTPTTVPTPAPSPSPQPVVLLTHESLSTECSVAGNLGPCSAIVDARTSDWLKHRWQVAADMNGSPLPLPQWAAVDFGSVVTVQRIKLDWETAYASRYHLYCSTRVPHDFTLIHSVSTDPKMPAQGQHVVHDIVLDHSVACAALKLVITQNATPWGASLWYFGVYGSRAPPEM